MINIEPANKSRPADICNIRLIIWHYRKHSNRNFKIEKIVKKGRRDYCSTFQ